MKGTNTFLIMLSVTPPSGQCRPSPSMVVPQAGGNQFRLDTAALGLKARPTAHRCRARKEVGQ